MNAAQVEGGLCLGMRENRGAENGAKNQMGSRQSSGLLSGERKFLCPIGSQIMVGNIVATSGVGHHSHPNFTATSLTMAHKWLPFQAVKGILF